MQAQHPGLTLTGMYNVLEKLRGLSVAAAGSRRRASADAASSSAGDDCESPLPETTALTDKERLIHDQGLVSLLHQLHDDLDAAVFAAYGWVRGGRPDTTLTDAEILERLVHLNAQRADEEKRGIIHWLRPEYQSRGQVAGEQEELALKPKKGGQGKVKGQEVKKPGAREPWPKPLAERIRATEAALHAAGRPVTAADLTKSFTRAKPADLQEILESLVTLGRVQQDGESFRV